MRSELWLQDIHAINRRCLPLQPPAAVVGRSLEAYCSPFFAFHSAAVLRGTIIV